MIPLHKFYYFLKLIFFIQDRKLSKSMCFPYTLIIPHPHLLHIIPVCSSPSRKSSSSVAGPFQKLILAVLRQSIQGRGGGSRRIENILYKHVGANSTCALSLTMSRLRNASQEHYITPRESLREMGVAVFKNSNLIKRQNFANGQTQVRDIMVGIIGAQRPRNFKGMLSNLNIC